MELAELLDLGDRTGRSEREMNAKMKFATLHVASFAVVLACACGTDPQPAEEPSTHDFPEGARPEFRMTQEEQKEFVAALEADLNRVLLEERPDWTESRRRGVVDDYKNEFIASAENVDGRNTLETDSRHGLNFLRKHYVEAVRHELREESDD